MSLFFCKANFCHYNLHYLSFISRQQLLATFLWDFGPFFMAICPNSVISVSFHEATTHYEAQYKFSLWDVKQGTANTTPGCSETSVGSLSLLIFTFAWGRWPLERSQWHPSFSFIRRCITLSCKMPWYFDESIMPSMCWSFPVPEKAKNP